MRLQPSRFLLVVLTALLLPPIVAAQEAPGVQDQAEPYRRFVQMLRVCHQNQAIAEDLQAAYADLQHRNSVNLPRRIDEYQEPYWSASIEGVQFTEGDCREYITWMKTSAADPVVEMVALSHQFAVKDKQQELDAPDAMTEGEVAALRAYIATVREHFRQRKGPDDLEWEYDSDPRSLTFGSLAGRNGDNFREQKRKGLEAAVNVPLTSVDVDEGKLVCTFRLGPLALAVVDHVYVADERRDEIQFVYIEGKGRWWRTRNIQISDALRPFADVVQPFAEELRRQGQEEAFERRLARNSCARQMGLR